ncbi:hypothetical protein K474DRAFT_1672152 [Panus rudis PR-1116 ss-1]|nr:hypothetical protein K474DRAFT_1672152 [Panus rudis PR-1116 ss-1]
MSARWVYQLIPLAHIAGSPDTSFAARDRSVAVDRMMWEVARPEKVESDGYEFVGVVASMRRRERCRSIEGKCERRSKNGGKCGDGRSRALSMLRIFPIMQSCSKAVMHRNNQRRLHKIREDELCCVKGEQLVTVVTASSTVRPRPPLDGRASPRRMIFLMCSNPVRGHSKGSVWFANGVT